MRVHRRQQNRRRHDGGTAPKCRYPPARHTGFVDANRGNFMPERPRRTRQTGPKPAKTRRQGEGEFLAQVVWQVICAVEQFIAQDTLALALPTAVAAPVGAVPGTTQLDWQLAAAELQVIMQVVVVEVCARRIFAPAATPVPAPPSAIGSPAIRMARARIPISSTSTAQARS